jgi:hypothetical protein
MGKMLKENGRKAEKSFSKKANNFNENVVVLRQKSHHTNTHA